MRDFTILIPQGAVASGVAATLDILGTATTLALKLKLAAPRWSVFSLDGGPVLLQNGMTVPTAQLPRRRKPDRSVWVLPGLGMSSEAAIRQRLSEADAAQLIQRVAAHAKSGGAVAASCSAVFFLQAAGLLKGRQVTTAWWLAPILKRMQPDAHVDADRLICTDGPLTTAGAAFAQTDLMLHLLRAQAGSELTDRVSRVLLLSGRAAQAPFIVPDVMASGDELVAKIAARVEAGLPQPPSVAALAQSFCMTERTLSRRIHRATGRSTQALVMAVRMRRARCLLENSRLTVEQVAEAVGYQDATALRRLMAKCTGANPSHFRPAISMKPAMCLEATPEKQRPRARTISAID